MLKTVVNIYGFNLKKFKIVVINYDFNFKKFKTVIINYSFDDKILVWIFFKKNILN